MLYTLNLDDNNFVLSIANTVNDDFEIEDLESLELRYLQAYQKVGDKLVLNEKRKQELIEEEEERKRKEQEPTDFERLEAQAYWTAMMTDTMLEE